MGFWGLELRTEKDEEKGVGRDGVGYGLEGEGEKALTQGFVHGGQHGADSGKSQNFF